MDEQSEQLRARRWGAEPARRRADK